MTRFKSRTSMLGVTALLGLLLATSSAALSANMVRSPLGALLDGGPGIWAQSEQTRGLPREARLLTDEELFLLYVGKTWKWGAGGGYFGPNGLFRARTFDGGTITDGGGTWGVNNKGRMCFRADWIDPTGHANANTCFDHAELGGDLYQRRLPSGDWYVFRHGEGEAGDEYYSLVDKSLPAVLAEQ